MLTSLIGSPIILQDPEKGLGGGISTEEAINILVKSYDSSEISHQVQKELAQIKIRVSLVTPLEGRNAGKWRNNLDKTIKPPSISFFTLFLLIMLLLTQDHNMDNRNIKERKQLIVKEKFG